MHIITWFFLSRILYEPDKHHNFIFQSRIPILDEPNKHHLTLLSSLAVLSLSLARSLFVLQANPTQPMQNTIF